MKRPPSLLLRGSARASTRGFTLVELMLVMVILAVFAAIVVPKFTGRSEQARVTAAQTQIVSFSTALDAYEVDTGGYPSGSQGLQNLVSAPSDTTGWRGPYLKSDIPNDPWGHAYTYECPGRNNPSGYDIRSAGPDGQIGTADDLTNATTSAR